MNEEVVILGAGLAGLGCARELPGARIFEAAARPGGLICSSALGGWHFDQGAHILHAKGASWVAELCANAGAINEIGQARVSNFWHGHWATYPVQNHLHELPAEIRAQAVVDFVTAQLAATGDPPRNYDEWCRGQYGNYLADRFYAEYTAKYWRVPMAELSTDWLAGRLIPSQVERIVRGAFVPLTEDQPAFARFRYPRHGGFEAFFAAAYRPLNLVLNARAVRLDPARRTVAFADGRQVAYQYLASSVPLPELVQITTEVPDQIRAAAASLRALRLLCVNLVLAKPALVPHHWFYIYDENILPARVSVGSNLAGRTDEGVTALQAEVFRRPEEALNTQELAQAVMNGLSRVLSFQPADVRQLETRLVPLSYVVSDHARAHAAGMIVQWYQERHIYPMGLHGAWKYVWSDQAYESGRAAAEWIRNAKA